jgi:hypothetical protein
MKASMRCKPPSAKKKMSIRVQPRSIKSHKTMSTRLKAMSIKMKTMIRDKSRINLPNEITSTR